MALKLTFKGNTHLFKGQKDISEISQYIKQIYPELAQLSPKFTYLDEENDEITVSCNDDLAALFEFKKTPKLIVSLPEIIPAFKMTQAIPLQKTVSQQELLKQQLEKEQQQKEEQQRKQEELKKQQEEKRQKMIKEKEERRKQMEQQRKEQIEKFFQDCKKDKHLSKRMTNFQAKLKEKMPEIEKFLQRDFTYEGTSSSSDSSENEEEQKENQWNQGFQFFPWAQKMQHMFEQQPQNWFYQKQPKCNWFGGMKCNQRGSAQNTDKDGKTVHRGYACDGCNQYPIVGARYECTDLPDFDYCETCYTSNNQHQEKAFEKVEKYVPPHRFWKKQQFQHQKRKAEERKKFKEEQEKINELQEELRKQKEQLQKQEEQIQVDEKKLGYELRVKKLAEEVSQILGNKEEAYYKVCDLYKNESVNFIIDQIFNSPEQYEKMI